MAEVAARPSAPASRRAPSQWVGIARTVVFDVAGPIAAYQVAKHQGTSDVTALLWSAVIPAIGVLIGLLVSRHLDVIGLMVLGGVAIAVVLGLATNDAKLLLIEGAVPTAAFAVACFATLRSRRPLMFRFAEASMGGPDTDKGRDFNAKYEAYEGMRHYFGVITIVWGVVFLLEAAAKVLITQTTSTGFAVTFSRIMPYPIAAVLVVWMIVWGRRLQREGQAREAQQRAAAV